MTDLHQWEQKIQQKRKQTSRRQFVKEIGSRNQMMFYMINGKVSRYPPTPRVRQLVPGKEFEELMGTPSNTKDREENKSFFENFQSLFHNQTFPYLRVFGPGVENCAYSDTCYNAKNCYCKIVN